MRRRQGLWRRRMLFDHDGSGRLQSNGLAAKPVLVQRMAGCT
jgi:hypothetical protein